jgi:tRNA dimethylallyltransferase
MILISGVTASGKTSLAEDLCRGGGTTIVSADSRCFFRGICIGNGKFTLDLSLPYKCVDTIGPEGTYTVFDFVSEARSAIVEDTIVTGGSMLHIDKLLNGLDPGNLPDRELRSWIDDFVDEFGQDELHRILIEMEPGLAFSVSPRDMLRMRRKIEEVLDRTEKISIPPMDRPEACLFLDRDDAELRERIELRTRTMLEMGWMKEVGGLLDRYGPKVPGLAMTGVGMLMRIMQGDIDPEEGAQKIVRENMALARSQRKWAKRLDLERIDATGLDRSQLLSTVQAMVA